MKRFCKEKKSEIPTHKRKLEDLHRAVGTKKNIFAKETREADKE